MQPEGRLATMRSRLLAIEAGEWRSFIVSFCYFFVLLACYYTMRPLRDALAANVIGTENLKYPFAITFVLMLCLTPVFGWLAARVPRRRLIPIIYGFFFTTILVFASLFAKYGEAANVAIAFWVWLSVFNVFVVSVFWSFMADVYNSEQAKRLFPPIAAGGSLGAISGPFIGGQLVSATGIPSMLLIAAVLLAVAAAAAIYLTGLTQNSGIKKAKPMGGSVIEGASLAIRYPVLRGFTAFMVLGTLTGSILYFIQLQILRDLNLQTDKLAVILYNLDMTVSVVVLLIQLFVTQRIVRITGLTVTLLILPVLVVLGFSAIAVAPFIWLVLLTQILRRGTLFAITNPVVHTLFAPMGPHSKYKFKSFLETAVYRAGDTTGSWAFPPLLAAAGIAGAAVTGAVAGFVWIGVTLWLGRRYSKPDHIDLP